MNYCLILIYSLLTLKIDAFLDEATEDNFREYQNDDWKYEFPYFKGNKGAFGWLKKEKNQKKYLFPTFTAQQESSTIPSKKNIFLILKFSCISKPKINIYKKLQRWSTLKNLN